MAVTTMAATDASQGDGSAASHPPRRRWLRRTLIGLNIFVAVCLVGSAMVYGYVRWAFDQINRVSVPSIVSGPSGAPINILVVGSDSRAFVQGGQDAQSFGSASLQAGARSDTTMVVHLDPKAGTATLLSIPRDLWVPIAGKGYSQRINTAFDVGPDLLVRTIQDNLGIPINHFVDMDFKSFREVVNALGGVKFWFPEPVHDVFSGLNLTTPGCYGLTGDMALSLVRARHMTYQENGRWKNEAESDIARIRRQQQFVKRVIVKAESSGLANITAINGVVGGIVNNITVDSGFGQKEMLKLAKRYRGFNPDQLVSMTLPTVGANIGGADVLLPIKDQDQLVVNAFLGQQPVTPTSQAPPTPVDPAQVEVRVLNGSGRTGEATAAVRDLRNARFGALLSSGRAAGFGYPQTEIRYAPTDLAKAQTLQSVIGGGAVLQSDSTLAGGGLVMITGQSYSGIHPATTSTTAPVAPAAPGSPSTSSSLPAFPGIHGTDPPPPGSGC
jgi:LCP family protein required for cell wall assembly